MNTVRINGQDYTSSLSDAEIAFIGPLSLPTGINSLSEGIVKHEEDISELNSNFTTLNGFVYNTGNTTSGATILKMYNADTTMEYRLMITGDGKLQTAKRQGSGSWTITTIATF